MENENILCVRVSSHGNEIMGTSFNPKEITKRKYLSKFYWDDPDEDNEFEDDEFDDDESEDDESKDDESEDDKNCISDYSIDSETFFEDIMVEIDLNGKTIFEYGSFPSDVIVVETEGKQSFKDVINPPENEVCVLWLYYEYVTSTYYWNDIVDFDINKLKIYCSTRINEIESKEYKLFSGLTYDDKDQDDQEYESKPGPGLDGPYTF